MRSDRSSSAAMNRMGVYLLHGRVEALADDTIESTSSSSLSVCISVQISKANITVRFGVGPFAMI